MGQPASRLNTCIQNKTKMLFYHIAILTNMLHEYIKVIKKAKYSPTIHNWYRWLNENKLAYI